MTLYLFTDDKGKKIETKEFEKKGEAHDDDGNLSKGVPGMQATKYRRTLQLKLKKHVVVWVHVGGDNSDIL